MIVFHNDYEIIEWLTRIIGRAHSYEVTSTRLGEAHEYVQKYLMPDGIGWGQNVWHSILDDAIRMRNQK